MGEAEGLLTRPESRTRYVLIWMDDIDTGRMVDIRRSIEDTVGASREQVEVDLWIESAGGDAHVAYKLAILLRHTACHVRVVVPDYAKSAATLLALVGDEIFLAPSAELGPLDAQLPQEGSLAPISALNISKAADEVARDAVALAIQGGGELLVVTGLSRAETLNAMLRFSAEFSQSLVCQLDPKLVHQAKELLRVTARYAVDLLETKLNGDAWEVAQRLVEDFPTHSFVIAPTAAKALGLPIRPIHEYDLLRAARMVHRAAEDGRRVVQFGPMDELLNALAEDDDAEGDHVEEDHEHRHERSPVGVEDEPELSEDGSPRAHA